MMEFFGNIVRAFSIAGMFVLFGANIYATILVFNRKYNKPPKGGGQLAAVWLLPVIGAIITIYIQLKKRGRL
jgi:hypothetical protein